MKSLRRATAAFLASLFTIIGLSALPAFAAAPNLTSIAPDTASVAGGTTITLTGSGFTGATGVTFGGLAGTDLTVVSDTSITVKTPIRSGVDRKIGKYQVVVQHPDGNSSEVVYLDFSPRYETENIKVGSSSFGRVVLGNLASRSQGKPIARNASVPPLTVTGTDSITGEPYSYVFERRSASDFTNSPAYLNESVETQSTNLTTTKNVNATYPSSGADSRTGVLELKSSGNCVEPTDGTNFYCSVFGPDVYTEAFYAQAGQSIAFDWAASDSSDAFEIYAFLVSVADLTTIPTPAVSNHTIATHAQGGLTSWRTVATSIPADGYYRFRMVNGSFDETGGEAIGSFFYLASVVETGSSNVISFGPFADWVVTSSGQTQSITASATSGDKVTVVSQTTGVCTVDSGTHDSGTGVTTYVVTRAGTATGECALKASQGATGVYAPASDVFRAFTLKTSATPPNAPFISSLVAGDKSLTVRFQPPTRDGGAPITNYKYRTGSGAWVTLDPPSTATTFTITTDSAGALLQNGTAYSISILAVNSEGDGTASNAVSGTPNIPPAPIINDYSATLNYGAFGTIAAPANSGGLAVSWSVSPALPAGLAFNTSSGAITGAPLQGISAGQFTITATNSSNGSDTAILTLTVVDNRPPSISYTIPSSGLNVGTSITFTPTNSGGAASSWAVTSGSLPAGFSLDASTGVVSGTSATPISSVSLTITATNSNGSDSLAIAFSVIGSVPPPPENLTALATGPSRFEISWSPPSNPGPLPITSYTLQVDKGNGFEPVSHSSNTAEVTGVTINSLWSFRVLATNSVGNSTFAVYTNTPPTPYSGPIVQNLSRFELVEQQAKQVTILGTQMGSVISASIDRVPLTIISKSDNELVVLIPGLSTGLKNLILLSSFGILTHQDAFNVVANPPNVVTESQTRKLNAGSFKGFVALYARGYQGARLSAKVGNDWVIIPEIPTDSLFRVVEFTGPGVQIRVQMFINRILIQTFDLITR